MAVSFCKDDHKAVVDKLIFLKATIEMNKNILPKQKLWLRSEKQNDKKAVPNEALEFVWDCGSFYKDDYKAILEKITFLKAIVKSGFLVQKFLKNNEKSNGQIKTTIEVLKVKQ